MRGTQSTIGALPNYQHVHEEAQLAQVPAVAYSTAKCSKNTMFAFTIKKLLKKIFLVSKHVRNTGKEKITIYIRHWTSEKQFHGTALYLCTSQSSVYSSSHLSECYLEAGHL